MCTKAKALTVAAKFGFVLDEAHSGKMPDGVGFQVTFDHPTHSLGGDCVSINAYSYGTAGKTASSQVWQECIERMKSEAPFLEECTDLDCEYHFPEETQ